MTYWQRWHDDYADPRSDLSQRLAVVQAAIRSDLDSRPPGPIPLLSMCAGQGHDVAGALDGHPRRADVRGLLVELDPSNVAAARTRLHGLRVDAVEGDAGSTSPYEGAVPADLLLVCGVFGNVPDEDVERTVALLPTLSAPNATVIWTRHRREPDLTPSIRGWFSGAGYAEQQYVSPGEGGFAVGVHRLTAEPPPYEPGRRLFTFVPNG
ncbi:MAG: SAM-dependent methyltransferase [Actinobacteria bacterium]|nr:SAM-dependent methyltransferase [Actinomycetota bacterium]MCA1720582.1 SAM-dependent methyltransferase [Actinomycetota bacterium]